MKAKACIFDLDGTLADTLQDLGNSLNLVLADRQFPTHPLSAIRQFIGHGIHALVVRSLPEECTLNPEEILNAFRKVYSNQLLNTTLPYPGIPSLLQELADRKTPLAVLSNKPDAMTRKIVASLFPQFPFVEVLGQREGVPSKPDPTSALQIASQLQVSPENCALIGDTPVDIETAISAGMIHVGVTWGFRSKEDLVQAGAFNVAHDISALRHFLL
jgi:phosphoglycolate phosphatase